MSNRRIYCAIDVDDKAFSVAVLVDRDHEPVYFKTSPNVSVLLKQLRRKGFSLEDMCICYEATYIGYDIYRKLAGEGLHCDVIAPSSIPRKSGKGIKTDRLDALKLVKYYFQGTLKYVSVPSKEDEETRRVLRSRLILMKQVKQMKTHILSHCRCMGWHYRQETKNPSATHWTGIHRAWLKKKIKGLPEDSLDRFNLLHLLSMLESFEAQVERHNDKIVEIADSERYRKRVSALSAFRGLDVLSALTIVVELGDAKRFPHPKHAVSYAGMSISQYSSGGKDIRFSITKEGNRFLRTALVEASQFALRPPQTSKALRQRRKKTDPESIAIADRCMTRLHKKSLKLLYRGKEKNKIKVACAREMLCFIWETLQKAA